MCHQCVVCRLRREWNTQRPLHNIPLAAGFHIVSPNPDGFTNDCNQWKACKIEKVLSFISVKDYTHKYPTFLETSKKHSNLNIFNGDFFPAPQCNHTQWHIG